MSHSAPHAPPREPAAAPAPRTGPTLYLLGTGSVVSDAHRTTTMLAFSHGDSSLLVDCGGDAVQRLLLAGAPTELEALIVTHEHPDHVSGLPLLLERLYDMGRREPLPVYGIGRALRQARRCVDAFDTFREFPPLSWREVAYAGRAPVLESERWRVVASPGTHSVPSVGLRVESRRTGGTAAYSCDTEPSAAIAELARGAALLAHDATGEVPGHSTARGAARVAADAGAGDLLLVHLPPGTGEAELAAARAVHRRTELGVELAAYSF